MQLLLALSIDAVTHSEGGPAEPLQGVTDAYYAGRAPVPPGHTDPEATALWREASTARTMAQLPVLACLQVAASVLYMYSSAGAFVAIMLATSAVPMFVVTGRYCALRSAGREPSWEQANTVSFRFPQRFRSSGHVCDGAVCTTTDSACYRVHDRKTLAQQLASSRSCVA